LRTKATSAAHRPRFSVQIPPNPNIKQRSNGPQPRRNVKREPSQAEGKPIELFDGANLLYLLETHAGIKARMEPPDDWQDPIPDAGELPD
jgi:hypothetical protein